MLRNVDLPAALKAVGPNVEDQTVLQVLYEESHWLSLSWLEGGIMVGEGDIMCY